MNFLNCQLDAAAGPGPVFDRAAGLRYKTFVRELGYEAALPGQSLETTSDDQHAVHFVFSEHSAKKPRDVGCVRLILPTDKPDYRFPCQHAYNKIGEKRIAPPFSRISNVNRPVSETSRLTISSEYRLQAGLAHLAVFDALVIGAMQVAQHIGLKGSYILAEPRMATHLQKNLGLQVSGLGPVIEHRGQRAAYWVSANSRAQGLFKWTTAQLEPVLPTLQRSPLVQQLKTKWPDFKYGRG